MRLVQSLSALLTQCGLAPGREEKLGEFMAMRNVCCVDSRCSHLLTVCAVYQYTKKTRYLTAARNIARYFLKRTPKAYMPWSAPVPTWERWADRHAVRRDFDAPKTPAPPADSSAAMIAAAGLQLLAQIETSLWNIVGAAEWTNGAHMVRRSP